MLSSPLATAAWFIGVCLLPGLAAALLVVKVLARDARLLPSAAASFVLGAAWLALAADGGVLAPVGAAAGIGSGIGGALLSERLAVQRCALIVACAAPLALVVNVAVWWAARS